MDSGRKAAIGPRIKTWVGGGSAKVAIKGRAVWKKIKKPSNLFVGVDFAAQQEERFLDSSSISFIKSVTFETSHDLSSFNTFILFKKKITIKKKLHI